MMEEERAGRLIKRSGSVYVTAFVHCGLRA